MSATGGSQGSTPNEGSAQDKGDNASTNQTCMKRLASAISNCLAGPEIVPIIAEHGVYSITGLKPGNSDWINQDNYAIISSIDQPMQCFIVLDGHGSNGHIVSKRCREMLPKYLEETNYDTVESFKRMHDDLESSEFETGTSGTTCVAVLIDRSNRLKVASVGDSRAILGVKSSGRYLPVKLNVEHKPGDSAELKRIKDAGGTVCVRHENADPEKFPDGGPLRVWSRTEKGNLSGLCMSRSLGDTLAHKEGVTHVPFRDMYPIDDGDDFVIMGSDGIWDVLKDSDVTEIATKCIKKGRNDSGSWDPQEVAETVAKAARAKWEEDESRIDDITCLVVKLA